MVSLYQGDVTLDYNSVNCLVQVWGARRVFLKFKVPNGVITPNTPDEEMERRGILAKAVWNFLTSANVAGILAARPLLIKGFQSLRQDAEDNTINIQKCENSTMSYKGLWAAGEAGENQKVGHWSISSHRGVPADASNTLWRSYAGVFLTQCPVYIRGKDMTTMQTFYGVASKSGVRLLERDTND